MSRRNLAATKSSIDVDEIAPPTPELERLAEHRTHEILSEWGRRVHVWGTHGLHNRDGSLDDQTFSLRDLAVACYMQGSRDAVAVAVTTAPLVPPPSDASAT